MVETDIECLCIPIESHTTTISALKAYLTYIKVNDYGEIYRLLKES